jgi:hypothetical protein
MTVYVSVSPKLCVYITETWLNDSFYNHSLLPDSCSVFRADRNYTGLNLTRGGGVLIAVRRSIFGCTRRHDMELTNESVRIDIPVNVGFNFCRR